MRFLKLIMMAGATMLASFAFRRIVKIFESQAENARLRAEEAREPEEVKRLKQDPATGVYYAED